MIQNSSESRNLFKRVIKRHLPKIRCRCTIWKQTFFPIIPGIWLARSRPRYEMDGSIRDSPQVHISINGEGEYVGQASSWAAATDEDSHSSDGPQGQQPGEAERCEGHDAKLGQQCDENALGLHKVAFDFSNLHGAAKGNHGNEEDGDAEDVDGFVEGFWEARRAKIPASAGICCCFSEDLRHVHDGEIRKTVREWKRFFLSTANGRSAIQEVVLDWAWPKKKSTKIQQ